jgi:hypothetical protein
VVNKGLITKNGALCFCWWSERRQKANKSYDGGGILRIARAEQLIKVEMSGRFFCSVAVSGHFSFL